MAAAFVVTLGFTGPSAAQPVAHRWFGTIYFGPSTTKYFGAVLQKFNFEPTGTMIGLAANRPFLDLGWDVALSSEIQVTQYFFGHSNTSFAAGLGFYANAPFGISGTSFSAYDGPSYALDPPYTSIGYSNRLWPSWRKKFLNYFSIEYAVTIPKAPNWAGVFRLYHRSGAFGLYSNGDDDGLAVGLGVRYAF